MEKEERLITTEVVTWHVGFESWIQFEQSGHDRRLHTTNQGSEAWTFFFCAWGGPVYLQRPSCSAPWPLLAIPLHSSVHKEHLSMLFFLLVSCFKLWINTVLSHMDIFKWTLWLLRCTFTVQILMSVQHMQPPQTAHVVHGEQRHCVFASLHFNFVFYGLSRYKTGITWIWHNCLLSTLPDFIFLCKCKNCSLIIFSKVVAFNCTYDLIFVANSSKILQSVGDWKLKLYLSVVCLNKKRRASIGSRSSSEPTNKQSGDWK